jgi:hypothetical protein
LLTPIRAFYLYTAFVNKGEDAYPTVMRALLAALRRLPLPPPPAAAEGAKNGTTSALLLGNILGNCEFLLLTPMNREVSPLQYSSGIPEALMDAPDQLPSEQDFLWVGEHMMNYARYRAVKTNIRRRRAEDTLQHIEWAAQRREQTASAHVLVLILGMDGLLQRIVELMLPY